MATFSLPWKYLLAVSERHGHLDLGLPVDVVGPLPVQVAVLAVGGGADVDDHVDVGELEALRHVGRRAASGPMSGSLSIIAKIRSMTSRNSLGELNSAAITNAPFRLTRLSYTFSCRRARTSSTSSSTSARSSAASGPGGRRAAARRRRCASARAPAAPAAARGGRGRRAQRAPARDRRGPARRPRARSGTIGAPLRSASSTKPPWSEALEAIAPRVARARPAPALREGHHHVALGEQARGVAGRGGHAAEPAQRRRRPRQLERAVGDQEARRVVAAHVVAAQRGGDHRRVPRPAAGLVGHDERGPSAGTWSAPSASTRHQRV